MERTYRQANRQNSRIEAVADLYMAIYRVRAG